MRSLTGLAFLALLALGARAETPTISVHLAETHKKCHTHKYRNEKGDAVTDLLIVRHGCEFQVFVSGGANAPTLTVMRAQASTTGWKIGKPEGAAGKWTFKVMPGDASGKDAPIGQYFLEAQVDGQKLTLAQRVWVLYNPWLEGSPVYIQDEHTREDLVMNEYGAIWVGGSDSPGWKPWAYDQFSHSVWSVVFDLVMEMGRNDLKDHVMVGRAGAKQIANKILDGKWEEPYTNADGLPWEWPGSADIYKVVKTQKRKARYGQCMVYSAVTASYFRALGMPAMSTSGYDFVQDAGNDKIIRVHYKADDQGRYMWDKAKNTGWGADKVWNFHAWTLVYMTRPDLKIAKVEPNILDGTWHAGPVSVERFKEQDMKANFDTKQYDASINSEVWYVYADKNGKEELTWKKPFVPANTILAKKFDNSQGCKNVFDANKGQYHLLCSMEMVTYYKKVVPKPSSRPAALGGPRFMALFQGEKTSVAQQVTKQHEGSPGHKISSTIPLSSRLGNNFVTTVKLEPGTPKTELHVQVWAVTYTNKRVFLLHSAKGQGASLRVGIETQHWGALPANKRQSLASVTHLRLEYQAFEAGKLLATDSRLMPLDMPKVNIICGRKEVKIHQKVKCQISFWNPMPWELDASLEVIISGNTRAEHKPAPKKIGAKVTGTDREKYVGRWTNVEVPTTTAGPAEIIAVVRSPHLNMVRGTHHIVVKAPEQNAAPTGASTSASSSGIQSQPQPQPTGSPAPPSGSPPQSAPQPGSPAPTPTSN